MFNVVTGPYHPTLESGLAREIKRLKSSDSLAPIAIVVPSEPLRRRLQWLLCVEHQCLLFDVHFLTFHQLALRLQREQVLVNSDKGVMHFDLVHDLCFEHLLSSLTKEHGGTFEELAQSCSMTGTLKALWRTIRDLKEGMVDPRIVLQGVQEGLFGDDERQKLKNLFTVYAMVQEASQSFNIGSADDLASVVIPYVKNSNFLSGVTQVCYYGFYDLTQVQLSLFEAITAKCRVTVYFPLSDGPAYSFARRFFDQHLCSGQSDPGKENQNPDLTAGTRSGAFPQVQVMHTVGPEDELSVVCKEILKLVETHQYMFEDIGVIARNFEPYQSSLRRTFEEHRIPFTSSATIPIMQEPFIKHLIQLSSLPSTEFFWRDVLDILTSPFYRLERFGVTRDEIKPELWHQAVKVLGIHRGQDQWLFLTSLMQTRAKSDMGQEQPLGDHDQTGIEANHVELLNQIMTALIADCRRLPIQGSIGEMTAAFLSLAKSHLVLPGYFDSLCNPLHEIPNQIILVEAIQQALTILEDMQVLNEIVTWDNWTQLFQGALSACTIAVEPDLHAGVRVLDAMSARGLPFRALFLLGLNEKVFPRFIREDAFLRDRSRRVLEETFGYKIDEKLAGYDEEQLLFTLLEKAAQERFYLVYQRADKEGRPLSPSPYLTDYLSSVPESNFDPEVLIPRRLTDRFRHPLFVSSFLTKEELGLKLIFQGYHPVGHLEKTGREPELFQNGWEALQKIESHSRWLGSYDGIIHSSEGYWQERVRKGVTPTSLEAYARCPFQYFVTRVLQAKSVRAAMLDELPASSLGDLCHVVLHRTYRQLTEEGWPEQGTPWFSLKQKIIKIVKDELSRYAGDNATGYFLTWELTKDIVMELVIAVVESDEQAYHQEGFRPMAFEVNAEGQFTPLGFPFDHVKIRGRLDRIDLRDDPPSLRIVDYKFQAGSRMRSRDRDLLLSGIRGFHLQPPLYVLMNTFHDERLNVETDGQGLQPAGVEFVYIAPRWKPQIGRSEFDASLWRGPARGQLANTIRKLLEGIQSGQYFILPGEYCRHCEVSTSCRRYHQPTWVRSHRASQSRQFRRLRTQDLQDD